ncbi:MAG: S8 family peptidase [Flavobacteriaceae bacterium]|nr:S8 family peptidase [Flavobacteriaceae bacterium]
MKKIILLAFVGLGALFSAQSNENIEKRLAQKTKKTLERFDAYAQKELAKNQKRAMSTEERLSVKKKLEREKRRVAFFFRGIPIFYEEFDTDQIKNSKADVLHNGQLKGLENMKFLGKGIHIGVFDGGKAYEKHPDFLVNPNDPESTRITNKEGTVERFLLDIRFEQDVDYSHHATGVTGMIGAKGHDISVTKEKDKKIYSGNTRGILPEATFENYWFETSVLDGESEIKSVTEKILGSKLNISNHSYGFHLGWKREVGGGSKKIGWYWMGEYNPSTGEGYNLDGVYGDGDKDLDDIVYNNPSMIIVKAAGNSYGQGPTGEPHNKFYHDGDGWQEFTSNMKFPEDNCGKGYDCISTGAVAKNIIVVGATKKIGADNKIVKSSYSSAGPRDDGAIKPDITGVGDNILFPATSSSGSIDWKVGDGTSFSSPQVTGVLGIWTEINKNLFNNELLNASSAKTLLIHSAEDAGNKGPDVWYGWGMVDAKKGAELLVDKSNKTIIFEDKELKNQGKNELFVETDGTQPLKVTISWVDPSPDNVPKTDDLSNSRNIHNIRTSRLVNDLDLRVINTQTNEVYEPWKLNIDNPMAPAIKGDNTVDNVEQVLIENPKAGKYLIQVSHKGSLLNSTEVRRVTESQKYSILVTGYNKVLSKEVEESSKVKAYPTLVGNDGLVNLTYDGEMDSVSVYDMSGILKKTESIKNKSNHQLDLSSLAPGVYILNIKTGNNKNSIKILKK